MASVNEELCQINNSSKLGAKFYKIVQNDVPYANSVVNTINEQAGTGPSRRHI